MESLMAMDEPNLTQDRYDDIIDLLSTTQTQLIERGLSAKVRRDELEFTPHSLGDMYAKSLDYTIEYCENQTRQLEDTLTRFKNKFSSSRPRDISDHVDENQAGDASDNTSKLAVKAESGESMHSIPLNDDTVAKIKKVRFNDGEGGQDAEASEV